MRHIIKIHGISEQYDIKKVYKTCYRACLNTCLSEEAAKKLCGIVADKIDLWVADQGQITSADIFERVIIVIALENEDVAFMYKTHRDIQ